MATASSLRAILNELNKTHGEGTVIMGNELNYESIPRISSGSLALDVILGGGWPVNQWHEVWGEASSGKTAVILHTIAANQKVDPDWTVWWLAAEHFDPGFAKLCGVDVARVFLHNTNVMEDGYQQILRVAGTREVDCIVIDSYPALVPSSEDADDIGKWIPGLGARTSNQFWRKQGPATKRSLTGDDRPLTGFVINQPREKIGIMYGDPETTPGGRGKNFAYFTRVKLRRTAWLKEGEETVGITIKAHTVKNKSHRPERTAAVDFYFAEIDDHPAGSYDTAKEMVDVAVAYDVIQPGGGGMFYYLGEHWKGRDAVYTALRQDPKFYDTIRSDVLQVVTKGAPTEEVLPPPKPKAVVKKIAKKKL